MSDRELFYFDTAGPEPKIIQALDRSGWRACFSDDFKKARKIFQAQRFNVGVINVSSCGDKTLLRRLKELLQSHSDMHWIMLIPLECLEETTEILSEKQLICNYCYDYHTHPVDPERLTITLGHALGMAMLGSMKQAQIGLDQGQNGLIGNSPVMQKLYRQILKVAQEDSPVLIHGETGTGKELICRAIHQQSQRSGNPMSAVNCGALPETLIQAELFGHEKGAFTGAHQRKIGLIEVANGGILFLDEIGELPLSQQVNLLRFLQDGNIERVGGTQPIKLDVRVISATHVNLLEAVREGRFREDLYYRLHVLNLEAPPLRERGDDIELLAWFFFQHYAAIVNNHTTKGMSLGALKVIREYDWPGNVRQLQNCLHRAMVMSENRLLSAEDLGLERRERPRRLLSLEEHRSEADKNAILDCLCFYDWNISHAAETLGVSRVTLYRLIEKYDLKHPSERI